MLRAGILMAAWLVSNIAFAGLAEDIVGTWTIADAEDDMIIVVTLNADGTYEAGIAIGAIVLPMEQGTYRISETELTLYVEGEELQTMEDVTLAGDQLSFYDPEAEETITATRGLHIPEPAGTGSISGTVHYDGEVSSGITVMAFMRAPDGERELAGIAFISETGSYVIEGLGAGSYMIMGVLGSWWVLDEENGENAVWGAYGVSQDLSDIEEDPVVVEEGVDTGGIDLTLYEYGFFPGEDPTTVQTSSWGAVKAAF